MFVAADACSVSSRRRSLRRRLSTGADDEAWATAVMLATDDISTSILLSAVAGEAPATVDSDNFMPAGCRIAPEDALGAHTCTAHDCPNRSRRPTAAMAMPIVSMSLNGTVALDMQLQYKAPSRSRQPVPTPRATWALPRRRSARRCTVCLSSLTVARREFKLFPQEYGSETGESSLRRPRSRLRRFWSCHIFSDYHPPITFWCW